MNARQDTLMAIGHPSVSVVVPVYDNPEGIASLLDALRGQTYPCFDIVVVDNGSSPELVIGQEYPFRLQVIRCLTPGSYAARNAGVCMVGGDILAFTDSDCVPAPDWIENGVRALHAGSEQVAIGGEIRINEPSTRTGVGLYQYASGFQQQENIERRGFAATANLFCTAEQFRKVGPFDERLFSGADREWAWRASTHGYEIQFCHDACVATAPRTSLRAAIRQARRVAAGRRSLASLGLTKIGAHGLAPHRTPLESLRWILARSQFSRWDRIRILAAAITIKGASVLEEFRLCLGFNPERQ
jgi:GT2 family glycosyltransferase